ncbi:3-methyladenine DNA glycosylase [Vibrio sp. UCD-FRSSP16_10]|uniref:DNA-3-methyladenine glycosylase I n=1 Tax=unclassified Vibrio TaxID=2614977 RepID=UPI0007FF7921|nr:MULTISPECIES: DNA-3-methyladenine glycosylase I [unclassified Vibrio]OBT15866.1 3-methyladenine DNA glycosylase [Vibrio sp. UCD-FRSSP16_10]OBT17760.1 3-methyladenine DNA glycosylase [Vibrio sp. UCD-FRSSP16_30]
MSLEAPSLEPFSNIYQRASHRKGGDAQLELRLTKPLTPAEIECIADDRWLSAMTMKVFQCGISWQVVRDKWPNFEALFFDFKPELLLMLSDEHWEQKAKEPKIIRHLTKVMTIKTNAEMLMNARLDHGGFSKMVAHWPAENITELWDYIKKHGSRLGGNTGAYTLRQMGVDTFILSSDVEGYLRSYGIIDGGRDTKKSRAAANKAFCHWQKESGRSMSEISQIIAFGGGDNRV